MAFGGDPRLAQMRVAAARGATVEGIDEGLRSHMLAVYNYMMVGLAITGLTAFAVASSPTMLGLIFGTPLKWVVMLAPIGFVFLFAAKINSMSTSTAQICFWAFAVLMGASLASVFIVYTGSSIARVFFITAATFGATSLYGYTTKRDLSQFGSFLVMGLIGVIIASVVNIFLGSTALQFAISVIGVLVFTGLTAWDTQRIKEEYYAGAAGEIVQKQAIMGALSLYLNFINMFVMLMQLFGTQRD